MKFTAIGCALLVGLLAQVGLGASGPDRVLSPLLVAHRGAADLTMPEASLAAYSNAVEQAMDIVKLDVQSTKDGVVVLGHDVTLKRNMGWDAKVRDLTYAEILGKGVYLPMGGVTNARIVRLDEALAVVKSVPEFWIDFKAFSPALAEIVLSTFAEAGIAEERIMVATFAYAALDYMKAKHPNVRRVAHIGGKAPTAQMVEEMRQKHGLWGVNLPHHRMARSEVERVIASKSLWVSLWFVQDAETARRWQDVGANAFVTDHASDVRRGLACHHSGVGNATVVEGRAGYNSWPMIQSVGGRLVCAYSRGAKHDIFEGCRGAFARISEDGGSTWSDPMCIADDSAVAEVPIGKGLDAFGKMLLWLRCYGAKTKRHELYRTSDGLRFEKIATPAFDPMPMQVTDVFHEPTVGLMALWFAGDYETESSNAWGTLTSKDNGRTWVQTTVEKGVSRCEWPTEPSAVSLGGGRILAVARSEMHEGPERRQFQLTSTDHGRTWKKRKTNIRDVFVSTPSLLLSADGKRVTLYYYERGTGKLRRREAAVADVFDSPERWPESEVLLTASKLPQDSGNANAVAFGNRHAVAFYSGRDPDTSVYVVEDLRQK